MIVEPCLSFICCTTYDQQTAHSQSGLVFARNKMSTFTHHLLFLKTNNTEGVNSPEDIQSQR